MRESNKSPERIRIDHVGIAVEDINQSEEILKAFNAKKLADENSVDGTFRWVYYEIGDASRIELITPLTEENSSLKKFLRKKGPGLHHVTFEVADIKSEIQKLRKADFKVIDYQEYEKRGWKEAIVSPKNPTGVLFQLMEYTNTFDLFTPIGSASLNTKK